MAVAELGKTPLRAEQVQHAWNKIKGLILQFGGETHVELTLDQGGKQLIHDSDLIDEAKGFLTDIIEDDSLGITLHSNGIGETPYCEVLVGHPKSLRGLQCYGFSGRRPLVSPRQNFDSVTSIPIHPKSCRRLNRYLNQDEKENSFKVTTDIVEFVQKLADSRPEGLKIVTS